MEGLPTSIVPREAHFAYVALTFGLAEIYVPFETHPEAHRRGTAALAALKQ